MRLFLSTEAHISASENGLSDILIEIVELLKFVTQEGVEEINNYGTEFKCIAIIPTCVNDLIWECLGWKEKKQISRKNREADIRLRMNYGQFMNGSKEEKRKMFIDIIVESIKIVQSRSKGDFKGNKLIDDILNAIGNNNAEDGTVC